MQRGAVRFRWSFLLMFALSMPAAAADRDPGKWRGIEHMMPAEDYRAAGLERLSPEELRRLNEWLLHFLAYDSPQLVKSDETIRDLQNEPTRRRIVGPFRGWTGDTTFRLDNGEVWKQRLSGRYAVQLDSPEVEIYKNLVGFYEMRVVETGRRIGVSRVK